METEIKNKILSTIINQTIGEPKIWLHSKLAEREIATTCCVSIEDVQLCIDCLIKDKVLKHSRRNFYIINKVGKEKV